jgi:predicted ester cyclase
MSEENKAVLRRFYDEFFNGGKLNLAEEIIAPDCPLYFGSMFMGTGPEAFKQTRAMMYSGFPDLHLTIEEMVAEGEKVARNASRPAARTKGSSWAWPLPESGRSGRGKPSSTSPRARSWSAGACQTCWA